MNTQLWPEFVNALKANVVAATGCTEPISLAYASAVAVRELGKKPQRIEAKASPNLLKNGMGVTVPGTGMVGMAIAAAVGAVGGDPEAGLNVLGKLTPEHVAEGKLMLEENRVTVSLAERQDNLYSESKVFAGDDWVRVCILDHHTNIILIEKNGEVIFKNDGEGKKLHKYDISQARLQDIFDFATNAPFEMLSFILESGTLNSALSKEGMNADYGMHMGRSLTKQQDKGFIANDLMSEVIIRTSAASDARMGGATLPAMSNSGSGNQGIAATMPVVIVGEHLKVSEETMARALILSHMAAVYIHSKFDPLSALCAAITAAMGSAAGMCWLMGGSYEACSNAIGNMVGDVTGMICDGASNSCAIKVSTAVSSAYKAMLLALDSSSVSHNDGIVAQDIEVTIANLCSLAKNSMKHTDRQIIQIMVDKQQN